MRSMLSTFDIGFTFWIYLAAVLSRITSQEIEWVISEAGESQAQACFRRGLNPLNMDKVSFEWNSTNFRTVVTDVLNATFVSTQDAYGATGCCVPGLWCGSGGCFTQGFGGRFSNFGWLNGNLAANPVYTCSGTATAAMTIASATLGRGQLTIVGNGFPSDSSASSAFLYGESCSELEFCNCQSCSASVSCPSGSLCLTKSSGSSSVSYCFPQCAALGDDSCACGYVCSVVFGEGSETIAMCLPEGYAQSFGSYHSQCTAHVGRATCSAPRAYQEQYQAAETVVSAVMDNSGDVRAIGSSSDVAAGFCATNADCFDGNVCTTDSCDTSTRLCQYASVVGCDSMQPAVTRRTTPYMYYSYYTAGSETAATQTSSVSYLNAVGTRSFATDKDDHPLQKIDLPFSFVYFGNLVSTGYVSPNGVLALPPAMECVNDQCFLLTSASNVISPFYTDWDPPDSPNAKISYYLQTPSGPAIWGVTGTAFHVLFDNLVRYHGSGTDGNLGTGPNTFAASMYPDGSVRISFVLITTAFKASDFFGLWGAFASSTNTAAAEGTFLRYHAETVAPADVVSGSEALYCSLGALACPQETCLATNDTLVASWAGATTCAALGDAYALRVSCSFAGGVAVTPAVFASEGASRISCPVPLLPGFASGSVVSVEIMVTAVRTNGNTSAYSENAGDAPGSKGVYVAFLGANNEVSRASLMIRYYNSSNNGTLERCGCNALPQYADAQCDSMGVCGGGDSLGDCAGVAFGAAVSTGCNDGCVAGMTGMIPVFNCKDDGGSNLDDIIMQTIVLLLVICCLMFLTMSVTYSIRRMLAIRAMHDDLHRFNEQLTLAETEALRRHMMFGSASRGLSEFEREALGKVIFTKQFYDKHKIELAAALHGTAAAGKSSVGDIESPTLQPAAPLVAGDIADTHTSAATTAAADACECTICLMELEEGNECRVLPAPCGHIFHVACIDQWFQQSILCPLCKRSIRGLLLGNDSEAALMDQDQNGPREEIVFLRNNVAIRFLTAQQSRIPGLSRGGAHPSSSQAPPMYLESTTGESGAAELLPSIRYARQQQRGQQQRQHQQLNSGGNFSPSRAAGSGYTITTSSDNSRPAPAREVEVELASIAPTILTENERSITSGPPAGDRSHIRYEGMPNRGHSDSTDSQG